MIPFQFLPMGERYPKMVTLDFPYQDKGIRTLGLIIESISGKRAN